MTIGAWAIFWFISAILIGCAIGIGYEISEGKGILLGIVITVSICVCVLFGMHWWFGNTESGKRDLKTQNSNFDGGIRRHVSVYDAVGNLIQEWDGKFDVDFDGDEQRILFDDENGKRHLVYFKTGTVVVEEVE